VSLTALDLFAGGGLASQGLRQASFTVVGAVEVDEACCQAYAENHGAGHVINAPVGQTAPEQWQGVDLVWLSPPCQQSSSARNKSLPRHAGADAGLEAIPYLEALRPRWVLLENVPGYVREPSFAAILDCLERLGYFVDVRLLNSADFGVAQTRRRLIVRACRDSLVPALPAPTPWAGWYEAIEDLAPSLPESRLADWQVARLPEVLMTCLIESKNANQERGDGLRQVSEPAPTIVTDHKPSHLPHAFLVGQQYDRPTGREGRRPQTAAADEPAMVVTASLVRKGHMPCAVLIDGQQTRPVGDERLVSYRVPLEEYRSRKHEAAPFAVIS
jgi:DNA (cytosine-5)-methyltransferase 1